jgi:hypothetical protein
MQIPVLDSSSVSTNVLPTPQRSGSSPIAQGLGAVGSAVQGVGSEMAEYAHQEYVKANSAVVMGRIATLNNKRIDMMNNPQTGLLTKQGENALNITPGGLEAFDKINNENMEGLNPEQKRLYMQHTVNERGEVQLQLMRHESEQGKALQQTNAKAVVDTDEQLLSTLYRDPEAFNARLAQMKAHTLDMLHMQGIPDTSPAAHEALFKATSQAYVSQIKQTMTENPTQAQHLFEVHQDEIEPHERDSLKHAVSSLSDEKEGIDGAFGLADHIRTGDKSEVEMEKMLHDQFANKPNAFKYAKAQLGDLIRNDHDDKVNSVADVGGKIESAIDEAYTSGHLLSSAELSRMPEYQQLSKMGHKEADAELNKIRSYMAKTKHEAMAEHHQAQSDERFRLTLTKMGQSESNRRDKENRDSFMVDISDPDKLTTMTEADLREQGRENNLKYSEITKLINQRKGYMKDPNKMGSAQGDHDFVKGVLDDMGVEKPEQAKYMSRVQRGVSQMEKDEKHKFTPEQKRSAVISLMQEEAVNTSRASIMGFSYGPKGKVNRRIDVKDKGAIVPGFDELVTKLEGKRGKSLTDTQRKRLAEEFLKEANH